MQSFRRISWLREDDGVREGGGPLHRTQGKGGRDDGEPGQQQQQAGGQQDQSSPLYQFISDLSRNVAFSTFVEQVCHVF